MVTCYASRTPFATRAAFSSVRDVPLPHPTMSSSVPAGWLIKESRSHPGRTYYYNTVTKESVWEMPTEPAISTNPTKSAAADAPTGGKADEIKCSHILVKHKNSRRPSSWRCPEITISKAEAITRLIEFRKAIIADDSQFEAIARKFSDCGSAHKGGDLGYFGRGVMQRPFEETAFGLRVGELVGLDVQASALAKGWVDLQDAQAHVLGKGSKRRSVPVGSVALAALHRWLALRGSPPGRVAGGADSPALFTGRNGTRLTAQSVWQRLQRRSLLANTSTPVHPHMLRHSFASHVLQSSSDLRGVQELLGHANISTTQVYTRLDFQHLSRAYDAAHPRAKAK